MRRAASRCRDAALYGVQVNDAPLQAARIFHDIAGPAHRPGWHPVPHGEQNVAVIHDVVTGGEKRLVRPAGAVEHELVAARQQFVIAGRSRPRRNRS